MGNIKEGNLVKFKAPLSKLYRVIAIFHDGGILIESTTKTHMLTGKTIPVKRGQGVTQLVEEWQIEKVKKKGLSGESTRLWALSSTPIYTPRENRY